MSTQIGTFELGTYGYPIQVLLSSDPANTVRLSEVVSIKLTLIPPDTTTPRVDQRALDVNASWVQPDDDSLSDTIKWTVQQGDHDVVGTYIFKLEIASDGGDKNLVTTGTYSVT